MHTAGVSYLQHHHHHQQQQQQQQSSHPMPSGQTAAHPLPAGQAAQQPLCSQVPMSHSNSVVQVYSTLSHMTGGGGGEIHTLGLQPFHPVLVSKDRHLFTEKTGSMQQSLRCIVSFRCPVSAWRANHSPLLLSTALGSREQRPSSAALATTWQNWVTLRRS